MNGNENTPLISVIIPAYNAERTLRRACDSVLAQSYPNVELIVVNDGSTDDTAAILEELSADNVKCVHQENGGVCRARNAGLEIAAGDYIFFLDADDELTPDCLTRLYAVAAENDSDITAGSCLRVRPDGTSFESRYDIDGEVCLWEGQEALENSLKDHPATYAVWGKLYRREVVEQVRFVEGKRIHEDSFFLFEVFLRPVKMAVTNVTAVRYYLTQNSASRAGFSEKFLDILYFANKKQEIIQEKFPKYLPLAKNVQVKASLALLKVMRFGFAPQFKSVEKACIATIHANAAFFVPATRVDRILFWIVRLRLYYVYKFADKIYRRIRK